MSLHGTGASSYDIGPIRVTTVVVYGVCDHVRDSLAVATTIMLESYDEFELASSYIEVACDIRHRALLTSL